MTEMRHTNGRRGLRLVDGQVRRCAEQRRPHRTRTAGAGLERFVTLENIKPENLHIKTWGNVAREDVVCAEVRQAAEE